MAFAPFLREDVMDVHVLAEEYRVIEFLARAKVLCSFLHQQGVDALVGSREAHTHGFQPVGAEQRFAHRRRLRSTLQPYGHFHEIPGYSGFDRRTIKLPKNAVPVPPDELRAVRVVLPGITDVGREWPRAERFEIGKADQRFDRCEACAGIWPPERSLAPPESRYCLYESRGKFNKA